VQYRYSVEEGVMIIGMKTAPISLQLIIA